MECRQQSILITGSSGEIGTNLGLRLLAEGYDVLGLDIRPNGWSDAFPTLLYDLAASRCDGKGSLAGYVDDREIDLVVHLAASAKVHRSVAEPEHARRNVVMAHAILEFCRPHRIPLIFSSSREVYGNASLEIFPENSVDVGRIASPYAAGKIAVEAFIHAYGACYGLRYLIFRLSNVYGRYDCDLDRMERVVPLFISRIARDEPVAIHGTGKLLDFTYVDDCVEGLTRGVDLLLNRNGGSHTVNLSRGEGHSLVELAECIGRLLGRKPKLDIFSPLTGEVNRYVADVSRGEGLLGYVPTTSLEEGIEKGIRWWRGYTESGGMNASALALRSAMHSTIQPV